MKDDDIFIGRQPIFTKNNNLFGYELLFRNGLDPTRALIECDNIATATVINNAMMDLDFSKIVGNAKAFINFSEDFFTHYVEPCFSPDNIIIEVLEDVPPTPAVIETIKKLKSLGFKIALDDFVFKPQFIPFLQQADIIKIDIENRAVDKLPTIFQKISKFTKAKLLAERVETKEQYDVCKLAGISYFQGYYFAKPEIIKGKKLDISSLHLLELMKKLSDKNITIPELEAVISQDIGLSHKLLKLAVQHQTNSMPEIDSIKRLLNLFGLNKVKSWATTISLTNFDGIVPEVFNIARTRAIFLKHYAQHHKLEQPDTLYLVGLFSLIDTILSQPMDAILDKLPLSDSVKDSLLTREGEIGKALLIIESLERNQSIASDDFEGVHKKFYISALKESLQLASV